MEKRERVIAIRVTENEYQELQKRKKKNRLAEWLRELGLGEKPKKAPRSIDPKLLYELNKIGVNLNQISRYLNSRKNAPIDLIEISLRLNDIENLLKKVVEKC